MRDLQLPGRSPVLATNGMCATSHPLAAQVALDILKRGGNAMDAAIAGGVLLGLCEPQMTGIGGDCFFLFTPPGRDEVIALNGSGRAPAGAAAAALRAAGHEIVPKTGIHSVTVPGAMDAFCTLSEDHGKIGLDAILAPSIHYANEGIPVAQRVGFDLPKASEKLHGAGRTYYSKDGAPFAPGEMMRFPGQAEVFKRVVKEGRKGFYEGEVAEDMLAALNAAGGSFTAEDFANCRSNYTTPISGEYGGVEVVEHPPNGQGATALLMLNILKHFDIAMMDPWGSQRAHIEAEATKLAYDARNRLIADPDHTARLEHMIAPETAAKLAALIDPQNAMPAAAPLTEEVHRDTIYITVVDKDRMAVSLIYSIFSGFGSGLASDKFGILFQNRGSGFTLKPGHPNELGPGKRPMHTIIPGIMRENGEVRMPFGVMGGSYQACGHARLISNMRDFGLSPQAAMDAPRSFAEDGIVKVERGYTDTVRAELSEIGHKVVIPDDPIGGSQAILMHPSGVLEGGSDPRKDGCALGY